MIRLIARVLGRRPDPARQLDRLLDRGAIRLHSWSGVPNVGDAVSAVLVGGLSGRPVRAVGKRDRRKLLACGSILFRARAGDVVWGTGTLHPGQVPRSRAVDLRAVRGPLTGAALRDAGFDDPGVYGDPALLLPRVLPRTPAPVPGRVGLVPHYQDKPHVRSDDPAVRVIDVQGNLEGFLDELLTCERVVSSSLHGLIFAEAYGIPAHEVRWSDAVRGAEHKFTDHYRGTGRERPAPLGPDDWMREPGWTAPTVDPRLIATFPFPSDGGTTRESEDGGARCGDDG